MKTKKEDTKKQLTDRQKENIVKRLNANPTFNMFGILNLSLTCYDCGINDIDKEKAKKFIIDRFEDEMATGHIEFK